MYLTSATLKTRWRPLGSPRIRVGDPEGIPCSSKTNRNNWSNWECPFGFLGMSTCLCFSHDGATLEPKILPPSIKLHLKTMLMLNWPNNPKLCSRCSGAWFSRSKGLKFIFRAGFWLENSVQTEKGKRTLCVIVSYLFFLSWAHLGNVLGLKLDQVHTQKAFHLA